MIKILKTLLMVVAIVSATIVFASLILHTVSIPVCVATVLALMFCAGIGTDGIWSLECYLQDLELSLYDDSDENGQCWIMFQHGQVATDMHPTRIGAIWELVLRFITRNSKAKESARYLAERKEL